jgi:hypothetical protein
LEFGAAAFEESAEVGEAFVEFCGEIFCGDSGDEGGCMIVEFSGGLVSAAKTAQIANACSPLLDEGKSGEQVV